MNIQQRIDVLRGHFPRDVVAALLGVTPAEVAAVSADPAAEVVESGANLSAVDQDITVLNGNKVVLADEPANGMSVEEGLAAMTKAGDPRP